MSSPRPAAPAPGRRYSLLAVCALSGLYAGLYLAVYYSFSWAPLLLVALAPFALVTCGTKSGAVGIGAVTVASAVLWFFGNSFFAIYNWAAVVLLALVHATIIGSSAVALRWWHRTTGVPLALLLPATFVGGEFVRLLGPAGIPTGLLALPFHTHLWMIQIADVGGVYAVSFAVASVSGVVADVLLAASPRKDGWPRWREWPLSARAGVVGVIVGWLAIAAYGCYRLGEAKRTMRPGPVVGVVQPDIPMTGDIERGFDRALFLREMLALSNQSAAGHPAPDLVVWPEAMPVVPPLNREWLQATGISGEAVNDAQLFARALSRWTTQHGVPLLVGAPALAPGAGEPETWPTFNSAILFAPSGGESELRQDKQRLFPIGETIPFAGTPIHRWLEELIASHSSVRSHGWYTPGTERRLFQISVKTPPAKSYRYTVSMCVEICYAESCGTFLRDARGGKGADFFVNISNDGIFQRNRAQLLHGSMAPFRAVEARVGIARSANTGISGFVKPTGEMYGDVVNAQGQAWTGQGAPELARIAALVKFRQAHAAELATDPGVARYVAAEIAAIKALRRAAGVTGQSTQPVYIDERRTLYSRTGDVFAWLLVAFTGVGVLGAGWRKVVQIGA